MISINARAARLAREAIENREYLNIGYKRMECGAHLLDFGLQAKAGWEAALVFTRLTLGDIGVLQLGRWELDESISFSCVDLFISDPLIACLGSQIAGWQLSDGQYATIGSGPARAKAAVPSDPYLDMTAYRDTGAQEVVLCIQDVRYPSEAMARQIAEASQVDCDKLYLAIAPSACITGSVQVAARMLEQCCHKMHEHGFDVAKVQYCRGRAPVAPVCTDEIKAMGRINDAILYGGEAEFWVDCRNEELEGLAGRLVSKTSSPEYPTAFAEIFAKAGCNFYNIDHDVHSIAKIALHNVRTGSCYASGEIEKSVIERSFLG